MLKILQAVERQFGKYTFEKDEQSRNDLKLIPKFTSAESIFSGIDHFIRNPTTRLSGGRKLSV